VVDTHADIIIRNGSFVLHGAWTSSAFWSQLFHRRQENATGI